MGAKAIISADASKFLRELNRVERSKDKLKQSMKALGIGVAALGSAFVAAGAAAVGFTAKMIKIGEEANTSEARIKSIANQLGIYGDQSSKVADRILDMANAQAKLTGIDRMSIRQAAAKMLNFRDLAESADKAGGAFDQTMQAAIDLSAAGFGSVESAAKALAMAMADPTRALLGLKAKGMVFNEEQREMLKLMHQNGDRMGILSMILGKTQASLVGTANATANATARIRESFGILIDKVAAPFADAFEESIGGVMESMETIAGAIEKAAPRINAAMVGVFTALTDAVNGNLDRAIAIGNAIGTAIGEGVKQGAIGILGEIGNAIFQGTTHKWSPIGKRARFILGDERVDSAQQFMDDATGDANQHRMELIMQGIKDSFSVIEREGLIARQQALMEQANKFGRFNFDLVNVPDSANDTLSQLLREIQRISGVLNAPAN